MKKLWLFILFVALALAHDSPYSLKKFHPILDASKLQAPKSSYDPLYSVKYGEFAQYANKYFYLQDRKYMTFFMCGKKNRSELRMKKDWKVDTKKPIKLHARVKLFRLNAKREFTFLQIHADSTLPNSINKPLLRIVWQKELHNLKNHLWAIIRTSPYPYEQSYEKLDLGAMPKGFFDVDILVYTNKMTIKIDNETLVQNFDVSYWRKHYNYFKAGVYLQDEGCAKALFDTLYVKGL